MLIYKKRFTKGNKNAVPPPEAGESILFIILGDLLNNRAYLVNALAGLCG